MVGYSRRHRDKDDEEFTGVVEIFGGLLAVFLVVLTFITLQKIEIERRALDDPPEAGDYYVHWKNEEFDGVVLSLSAGRLTVIETSKTINLGDICDDPSFVSYIQKVYSIHKKKFLLYVTDGGVPLFRETRDCILETLGDPDLAQIFFIIADREVIKIRPDEDLPDEIRSFIRQNRL